jgi:hypothetical protein
MYSRKESNELFSGQEIDKAHMLQFEESWQNPSRSFWEETSATKVEKGVREESGDSREIVKRKGFEVFFAEI